MLNEVEYAEKLLSGDTKDKDPYSYLPILSKYYRQILDYSPKKTIAALNDFMVNNYINYNPVRWCSFIESCVKRSKKLGLSKIQFVGVTQRELDVIQSTKNNTTAKVLFSLLCIAKYFNMRRESNNSWTNIASKDIFRMSNVSTTIEKQDLIINELYRSGLVGMSKKIDNLNTRVLCVDDGDDFVLKISDFRNLGNEYMNWKQGGYFRCAECGALRKQNKYGNRIYCNDCVGYLPLETKKIVCVDCGKEFVVDSLDTKTKRCPKCYKKYISNVNNEKYRSFHPDEFKTVFCIDCGCEFTVPSKDNQTTRCPECYKAHLRNQWALASKKYRDSKKQKSS